MSDRELLELAAKAAGIEYECYHDRQGLELYHGDLWNPLTDDGDALRLAVKLGMEVYVDTHPESCKCTGVYSPTFDQEMRMRVIEHHGDDPLSATRRAIVRAAAEIGKEMV